MSAEPFFDTNVVIYALIDDSERTAIAKRAIQAGGIISVQVINELTNTLRRKFRLSWSEIDAHVFHVVSMMDDVRPITAVTSVRAQDIAERHNLLASALEAGCRRFISEDMQDGFVVDGLKVENPFRS
jgi:predicted nucleic acid-binding protein